VDGNELAGPVELDKATSVSGVGLYAGPGRHRNEARRDHLARHPKTLEQAGELVAGRPGFVTNPHRSKLTEGCDESTHARLVVKEPVDRRRLVAGLGHRRGDRVLVDLEADKFSSAAANFLMDTVGSLRMWLGPASRGQPT
jgi:hypothetical protein